MLKSALVVLGILTFASASAALTGFHSFSSAKGSKTAPLMIRHCSYEAYATTNKHPGPSGDYVWKVVPALNGKAGAVSLQSSNFMTKYLSIITKEEDGRLGALDAPNKDDASFDLIANADNTTSFQSLSVGPHKGHFITLSTKLQGGCSK